MASGKSSSCYGCTGDDSVAATMVLPETVLPEIVWQRLCVMESFGVSLTIPSGHTGDHSAHSSKAELISGW